MISHPTPSRHCAVEFQALPSRIGQVRRIVSAQLRYWHLPHLVDTAALGVTELLANVHRHTGADKQCTVEIVLLWDRLTISVRDHDPRLPEVRSAGSTATSGRGLALVAAVSESWGMRAQQGGEGKVVWFTLPAPPPRRPLGGAGRAGRPALAAEVPARAAEAVGADVGTPATAPDRASAVPG
ncbi:ATP-binding protein [Streptomyces sp. JJ38]|uniref:ATP-binding protein n=1 Tax=Streptomyces sp. JJ38 TaxID=2738128 RepID=UPI001C5845FC|nr:ATP-binding protein [Streptomyces sp. JJ38]MBW1596254.1 ATP-binding protein [Streptomyces sp. JJ38]